MFHELFLWSEPHCAFLRVSALPDVGNLWSFALVFETFGTAVVCLCQHQNDVMFFFMLWHFPSLAICDHLSLSVRHLTLQRHACVNMVSSVLPLTQWCSLPLLTSSDCQSHPHLQFGFHQSVAAVEAVFYQSVFWIKQNSAFLCDMIIPVVGHLWLSVFLLGMLHIEALLPWTQWWCWHVCSTQMTTWPSFLSFIILAVIGYVWSFELIKSMIHIGRCARWDVHFDEQAKLHHVCGLTAQTYVWKTD